MKLNGLLSLLGVCDQMCAEKSFEWTTALSVKTTFWLCDGSLHVNCCFCQLLPGLYVIAVIIADFLLFYLFAH